MSNNPQTFTALNVRKSYGDHLVLPDVSLSIDPGRIVCLLGPSGCGKSTLAKICASLLSADSGTILVGGRTVKGPDPDRFMIFQEQDQIFPWKTAFQNVAFPLRLLKRTDWRPAARAALEEVGLADAAAKYPHELSGGMRQRVALARAFAMRPSVLIMDEPFAGVDASRRVDLQEMLIHLVREHGQAVLFVTHEIDESIRVADQIVVMSGAGEIAARFSISEPHPRDPRSDSGASVAAELFRLLAAGA